MVDQTGEIQFPALGIIKTYGLTKQQLGHEIARQLAEKVISWNRFENPLGILSGTRGPVGPVPAKFFIRMCAVFNSCSDHEELKFELELVKKSIRNGLHVVAGILKRCLK